MEVLYLEPRALYILTLMDLNNKVVSLESHNPSHKK